MTEKKINAMIIDNDPAFHFSLSESLKFFSEIEIQGWGAPFSQTIKNLQNKKPDLVFLDIDLPVKNALVLYNETRKAAASPFTVIFCCFGDDYMVRFLHSSTLEYLMKPVKIEELRIVIERFKKKRDLQSQPFPDPANNAAGGCTDIVSLPTSTGLKFVDKHSIVFFQCVNDSFSGKPSWEAHINNRERLKLKANVTGKIITSVMGEKQFIQIGQSEIVNLRYLNIVEFKTRECLLIPPFDHIRLKISRAHLTAFRHTFDLL
jgi:two-component system, LytTR family, response regulator